MRKLLGAFILIVSASPFFTSCNSETQASNVTPTPDGVPAITQESPAPKDTRPSFIELTPTEFGLTELSIIKNDDGGDCAGKGNIQATFEISFSDSINQGNSGGRIVTGYDCGSGATDGMEGESMGGKRVKELHELLMNCKNTDLSVTYQLVDSRYVLDRISIKEKRVPRADGKAAKVTPSVVVW